MPWTSWLLLVVAVGLGLIIELTFLLRQSRIQRDDSKDAPGTTTE
ncbi:MAG: hypothetical protein ACE5HT_11655 [Gemmatimonadales bacterium]